mmetsp:Transcript_59902/g.177601  ORF Transcript_59902/g.177601 Transcript_59902/m.177601 type:complete len:134 (-) Transcript_59902:265-666(-)
MGYGFVLDSLRKFDNVYAWMGPEGPIEASFQRFSAPGEKSSRGPTHYVSWSVPGVLPPVPCATIVLSPPSAGAGIVVSNWKGIDPYHTAMASVRGIEEGFSVVTTVRTGTSAAYDPHDGNPSSLSWFADEGGS